MLSNKIKDLASRNHPEIVSIRRHLHMHPELSYQEKETGLFIAAKLKEWGIRHEHGWAENGVVAFIEGQTPESAVIALRADIDALPIQEANDVPYCSQNPGVMHACGHDVHTASLLGTAFILNQLKAHFRGTVKLIFQPAEEKLPGGASILIKEGVLQKPPKPSEILGQHVLPELPAGKVGIREGMFMASADEIYMTVTGKGGHAAAPHQVIDPVFITSQIIVALQQVVSRRANPIIPSVLSFGKINSTGGATNVIPNEVKVEGTFRTMDEIWRAKALSSIEQVATGIAKSLGGFCEVRIEKGYPCLINEPKLTRRVKKHAINYLGADKVVEIPMRLTAEDFAYYSQVLPACFYRLGTANEKKGINAPVHTNTFDVDEKCLETGAGLMAWLAVKELEGL